MNKTLVNKSWSIQESATNTLAYFDRRFITMTSDINGIKLFSIYHDDAAIQASAFVYGKVFLKLA